MSAIERFLDELDRTLIVRGRQRLRLVAECRDHLAQSSAVHGPEDAVRRFGAASELAAEFDTEVAVRRGLAATVTNAVAVVGVGWSTLAVVHGADPHASAQVVWAVVFFGAAQVSAAALALAALRALAMRHLQGAAADVAVLCRRNVAALGFALLTLFAAAAALPGHAPAWMVLTGPALALVAGIAVARTRSLTRKLDADRSPVVRAPLVDVAVLMRASAGVRSAWVARPATVLMPALTIAVASAFAWDQLDQGTLTSSWTAAGLEAALTLTGFVLLGPALGLWSGLRVRR